MNVMKSRTFLLGAMGLAAALSGACGGGQAPQVIASTLVRASSCDDLLRALKADARRKMNAQIDASEASLRWSWSYSGGGMSGAVDNAGAAPPSAGAETGQKDSASSWSQTNVQVQGVDEADFVKNDGKYIYLLHGKTFQVIQAWPAAQMGGASAIDVEGWPTEMFVDNGRVVIYSQVDGTQVMASAGVAPRAGYSEGNYYFGAPACLGYGCGYWAPNPLTKVTVLALDNGTQPRVTRETYFEGSYLSSRRVGSKVRTVLTGSAHGPALKYWPDWSNRYNPVSGQYTSPSQGEQLQAFEQLRAQNEKAIAASTVADWLPYTFARGANGVTASLAKCEDYLVPTEGSTQYGLTQLASLDLDQPNAAPQVTSIVGAVDQIYSNADTMVLAARSWMPWSWYWDQGVPDGVSVAHTHLHAFDIASDPIAPKYSGSATVPGTVHDQFSIDVQKDVLRVATTEQRTRSVVSSNGFFGSYISRTLDNVNRVFTARIGGGKIAQLGDVGDLAKGERIQSARFVGDKGYVVTFRNTDPLFVIDLANPSAPKVLGEAKIPGFSTYMHPLDAGHLLTVGRDADANGRVTGLAVQIFDVTNPAAPALAHKFVFPTSDAWNYSEALSEHKAFTYFPEKQLLAFPYYSYDWRTNTGTMKSSAELFHIDVQKGIEHVGGVEHTSLFGTSYRGWCGGFFSPQVRRAVFMDDVMYSLSYGGIIATDTRTMAPLQTLQLSKPIVDNYSACYGD